MEYFTAFTDSTHMIILGIDPGTTIVGYAILQKNNNDIRLIEAGAIRSSHAPAHDEKISSICADLRQIIDIHKPQALAIEKIFFFKNNKTAISVAEAKGALILTAKNEGLTVAEYTPLEVKMAITGYGRADKKQIQYMVKAILKLESIPKLDDTTDAMAIALTHAHRTPKQ